MQQNPKDSLNTLIKYALLHYNNSIHSTTNFTPFKVVSGHFSSKNPYDIQESDIISKYVEDHKLKMTETYKQLQGDFREKKEQTMQKMNETRDKPMTITKDDQVYHKQETRDKLAPKFTKVTPVAQTKNKIKTDTSKYSKHNLKRRKKYQDILFFCFRNGVNIIFLVIPIISLFFCYNTKAN